MAVLCIKDALKNNNLVDIYVCVCAGLCIYMPIVSNIVKFKRGNFIVSGGLTIYAASR